MDSFIDVIAAPPGYTVPAGLEAQLNSLNDDIVPLVAPNTMGTGMTQVRRPVSPGPCVQP